jgi:hypothetical protein
LRCSALVIGLASSLIGQAVAEIETLDGRREAIERVPSVMRRQVMEHVQRVFAARRAALGRLLAVLSRGMDLLHQDPVRARSIYLRATGTAENDPLLSSIFDATVPCFTFDLTLSTDYFDALSQWMAARGLIAAAPPTPWTNALALAPRR